jgi:hypothetical protein
VSNLGGIVGANAVRVMESQKIIVANKSIPEQKRLFSETILKRIENAIGQHDLRHSLLFQ